MTCLVTSKRPDVGPAYRAALRRRAGRDHCSALVVLSASARCTGCLKGAMLAAHRPDHRPARALAERAAVRRTSPRSGPTCSIGHYPAQHVLDSARLVGRPALHRDHGGFRALGADAPVRPDVYGAILATMFVPYTVSMVSLFLTVIDLPILHINIANTYWAIWLPSAANAFNVLIAKRFFDALPAELFDAARVDGAEHLAAADPDRRADEPAAILAVISLLAVMHTGRTSSGRWWPSRTRRSSRSASPWSAWPSRRRRTSSSPRWSWRCCPARAALPGLPEVRRGRARLHRRQGLTTAPLSSHGPTVGTDCPSHESTAVPAQGAVAAGRRRGVVPAAAARAVTIDADGITLVAETDGIDRATATTSTASGSPTS